MLSDLMRENSVGLEGQQQVASMTACVGKGGMRLRVLLRLCHAVGVDPSHG